MSSPPSTSPTSWLRRHLHQHPATVGMFSGIHKPSLDIRYVTISDGLSSSPTSAIDVEIKKSAINSDYGDGLAFFLASFSNPSDTSMTFGGRLGLMNETPLLTAVVDPFVAVVFSTYSSMEIDNKIIMYARNDIKRGTNTFQPVVISDGEGETDDDFHTTPPEPPRIPRMPTEGPNPAIKLRGVAKPTSDRDASTPGTLVGCPLRTSYDEPQVGQWEVYQHHRPRRGACTGLPNGPVPITERDGQLVGTELRAWREETKQRKGKITVKVLAAESRKHEGGGEWFRRHFCVIVVTTIIASVSNGYANQKTVHMFHDFDRIKDLDWCTYLLRSLVDTRGSWSQDAPRKYTGPLLFLTLLYVDRVVVSGCDVPRALPMLNGWTSDLLKAREAREITAGGFGLGLLEDPPHATSANTPLFEPPPVPQHAQFTPTQATVHPIPTGGTPLGFAQLFETVTRDLLLAATRVVHMARENCTQAYGDHNLERVAEASQLLLGVLQHEPKATYATIADDPHMPGQTSMEHEEAFWQDPENIRALERAEMAAIRATTIDNMPSFSLGFTQDEPTQGDEKPITPRAEMAAIRATTIDDMPSFSLGFTQGDPTQGDEGLITPIAQVSF
nr:uncharacterized protein LOC109160869 [Ipomoea batatas]